MVESSSALEDLFFRVLDADEASAELLVEAALAASSPLRIHLPHPPIDSSISASYMRAFVEIQAEINRLASKVRSGEPNAAKLTQAIKRELELSVVVTDGSSNFTIDLTEVIKKALGKMTGKQIALTVVFVALVLGTTWGAVTFFETQKTIKLEEIKSADHQAALSALQFATQADLDRLQELTSVMQENVQFGREVVELLNDTYEEVLKAAAETNVSEINGQTITGGTADLLTLSTRLQSETTTATTTVRVIDIRTEDIRQPHIEVQDVLSEQRYKFDVEDSLFADVDRAAVFESLETGRPITVELSVTLGPDGTVRSTQFLRVVPRSDGTNAG